MCTKMKKKSKQNKNIDNELYAYAPFTKCLKQLFNLLIKDCSLSVIEKYETCLHYRIHLKFVLCK